MYMDECVFVTSIFFPPSVSFIIYSFLLFFFKPRRGYWNVSLNSKSLNIFHPCILNLPIFLWFIVRWYILGRGICPVHTLQCISVYSHTTWKLFMRLLMGNKEIFLEIYIYFFSVLYYYSPGHSKRFIFFSSFFKTFYTQANKENY